MSVLDTFFGRGGKFFNLLEEAAQEVIETVEDFATFMEAPSTSRHAELLRIREHREKDITRKVEQELVRSYLTELERHDIMLLAEHLNRIPRTITLLAKHVVAAGLYVQTINFSRQITCMEHSADVTLNMIKELRNPQSILRIRNLFRKILRYHDRAEDDRILLVQELYSGRYDPMHAMALRDKYVLCEKIMDRFDAMALIIMHVSLKNS